MKTFAFKRAARPLFLGLFVLLLAGCRTYGGYGSEEATLAQIEAANERFADELQRAQAEAEALASIRTAAPHLAAYIEAYAEATALHADLLTRHQEKYERLQGEDSYRTLSRALGAIVSEENLVRDRYYGLRLAMAYPETMPRVVRALSAYQAVPPYYLRIEAQVMVPTVEQLVARYRGTVSS